MTRYDRKPLLRLLECYVLWVIDALPEQERGILEEITPKLQAIYGIKGTWQYIVSSRMNLSPDMRNEMKRRWLEEKEFGSHTTPQEFARIYVDQELLQQ